MDLENAEKIRKKQWFWETCKSDTGTRSRKREKLSKDGITELEKLKARMKTEKSKRCMYLCSRKVFDLLDKINSIGPSMITVLI